MKLKPNNILCYWSYATETFVGVSVRLISLLLLGPTVTEYERCVGNPLGTEVAVNW